MKLGLREKIILSMVLISMTVSMILSVVFYRRSVTVIENNYTKSVTSSLYVCAGTFDDMMRDTYLAAVNASTDDSIRELMQTTEETANQQLMQKLEEYRIGNIDSIYCYIPGRSLLLKATQSGVVEQRCSGTDILWLEKMTQEQENPLCPQYADDETSVIEKPVFLYSKPVLLAQNGNTLGYLLLTVDERIVYFSCLQGHGHFDDGESYLLAQDDTITSCFNLEQLHNTLKTDEDALSISVTAPLSQYRMMTVTDRSALTGDIRQTRNEILLMALLFNLLACIPILLIVQSMMRPMQELTEAMKQVGQGNLQVRATIYHEDEIGELSEGFNDMVHQIEDLIEELVTQKLLKKEAELEALQYQITPHFMYNTLNSIKYAAILQNSNDIADLLEAFIELLQLSASDRGAFISIEQEMHMVNNYVKLQRFRYANSFEVMFDVAEDAKKCYIPSLLIQPLVENAILHGIDLKKPGGRIAIRVLTINHEVLAIKVEDNGGGMTEKQLQQMTTGEQRSKFSGIGVRNIRERLRLYYGEQGRLKFYSERGYGTRAVVTVPISYDAEEYTL